MSVRLKWCPLCHGKVKFLRRTPPYWDKDKKKRDIQVVGEVWACQNPECGDTDTGPTMWKFTYKTDEQMKRDTEMFGEKAAMGDMFAEELDIKSGKRQRRITLIEGVND